MSDPLFLSTNLMKKILILALALMAGASVQAQQPRAVQHFAHRASRYEFEENTLAAFEGTYNKGIRGYETDIRMTADGELVISHDESLSRLTPSDGNVEKMTRKEIGKVRTDGGNKILFADELAKWLSKRDSVYVEWEMKSGGYDDEKLRVYCDKLYNTAMKKKPANSTYLFTSFDKRTLRTMRELHPDADLMLIIGLPLSDDCIKQALDMGVKRLACTMGGTNRDMVMKAKKAGLIVSLWPGGGIEDFQLGVALGADALCCDKAVEVMEFAKKNMPWVTLTLSGQK